MKKINLISLLLLSVIPFSACTKKTTTVVPYPSISPSSSTGPDNSQNYAPFQQGVGANPDYYGNGATLSDDTSSFNNGTNTATNPNGVGGNTTGTSTTTQTSSTGTTPTIPSTDDLGIPATLPNLQPYAPPTGGSSGDTYSLAGNLLVDQDNYIPPTIPYIGAFAPSKNQWQGVGVAATSSDIMISAFDLSGFFKKGTVITMNASTGKDWKNIGSTWLGTKYPMDSTVKGITVDSTGKMFAVDSNKYIYVVTKTSSVQKVDAGISGGIDITAVSDGLIVATSTGLKKYAYSTLNTGAEFSAGLVPTGGICTDKSGNIYAIVGTSIKKITPTGTASDVIANVNNAVDVAVNDKGRIFVLTKEGIIMYDDAGKQLSTFGGGDFASPTAIAASGTNLYVADNGTSYKDSQVVKYSVLSL